MTNKKTWQEFRDAGMLWFANMILHTFGWAICIDVDPDTGEAIAVYPARCKYRGFGEKLNTEGYKKVSKYMKDNVEDLLFEAEH